MGSEKNDVCWIYAFLSDFISIFFSCFCLSVFFFTLQSTQFEGRIWFECLNHSAVPYKWKEFCSSPVHCPVCPGCGPELFNSDKRYDYCYLIKIKIFLCTKRFRVKKTASIRYFLHQEQFNDNIYYCRTIFNGDQIFNTKPKCHLAKHRS